MNTFIAYEQELLSNSWSRCWPVFTDRPLHQMRDTVIWKYCDPRRHYHNISHLIGCITMLGLVRHLADEPALLELALWIHDLESDPTSTQNERRSLSTFFTHYNAYINLPYIDNDVRNKLIELVMTTTHNTSFDFGSQDQKLICDIDLVTLGGMESDFEIYCHKVRKEYFMFSDDVYYINRLSLLTYFLTRGFIYRTPYFRERCEAQAIKNLTNEINRVKLILEKK
jgi:predicted metal-dependent HD superfamily phosphohydrolase